MTKTKEQRRQRRKLHIRKTLSGVADKPRVYVKKSNKFIEVGVANDDEQKVMFSTRSSSNVEGAKKAGAAVGKMLKDAKISTAVFDRSGYKYHGVVAQVADAIRESGIAM